MEFQPLQSALYEAMGLSSRIKAMDKEIKDAPADLKAAYETIRADLVTKYRVSAAAFKSKVSLLPDDAPAPE